MLVVKRNAINECINGCGNVALNSLKVNLEKQVVVVDAARERRMNVNYIFLWFEISLPRGTTLPCSRARPDTLINAPTMKQAATRLNVSVSYALFLSLSLSPFLPSLYLSLSLSPTLFLHIKMLARKGAAIH